MFEYKIQKGWDRFEQDFGLTRISLAISLFNTFLFALCYLIFEQLIIQTFYPVIICLLFVQLRPFIIRRSSLEKFSFVAILLTISIVGNYYLVGLIDKLVGFTRLDQYAYYLEKVIWNKPLTMVIYEFLGNSIFSYLYYDLVQISYMTYYLYPVLGAIFYYKQLGKATKYKIGRFAGSIVIFFNLNYLFYLLVPISGPQYYLRDLLQVDLNMTLVGNFFFNLVKDNHPNFIDCFPSGHAGIAILVTIWMFKIKNHYRYVFLFFALMMIQATIALKYHYIVDVLAAIPFALLCYYIAYKFIPNPIEKRLNTKWRF